VLPERDVVWNEYNYARVRPTALTRADSEQVMAALYLNHPYGRP